jgi:exosortase
MLGLTLEKPARRLPVHPLKVTAGNTPLTGNMRHCLFALFSFVLIALCFDSVRKLIAFSLNFDNTDSSYVLLIPFISAMLLYTRREKIFAELESSSLSAMFCFAIAGTLYFAGRTFQHRIGPSDFFALIASALIFFWIGGFLLFYGRRAFRAAVFPLMFLGLAIPIPGAVFHGIARLLQSGSASMVSMLFRLTGTPAFRNETVFMLPRLTIEVAEECSGIRSTLGILIVSLLAAHLFLKSKWRRTALLLLVIPISLFKNAVRITALTLLAIHWDMGFMTGKLHHEGGVVFMMIGLILMYPVLTFLMRSEAKHFDSGGVRS